ncbi:hypothetical protein PV379_05030 [Streptomyces caniscabiei]|nr:hypothetical protein [Streptomyces caniscabiei]MDX2776694.1 hypothetical protein [Streptomyces caniscabiei]
MQNIVSSLIFGGAGIAALGVLLRKGLMVGVGMGIACLGGGALLFVR